MFSSDTCVVMCFSGLDPSGGAGIQADIESLACVGCHCAPIVTLLTSQDTGNVKSVVSADPGFFLDQARTLLEDMPVKVFKIGVLGSVEIVEAIHGLLVEHQDIPVVLDPIVAAGGGTRMAQEEVIEAIKRLLIPQTTILTPNVLEAYQLCPQARSLDDCAHHLMELGCEYVLITGAHEDTPRIVNRLWGHGRALLACYWDRLAEQYHGSGCTLAASLSGYLAQGQDLLSAVRNAQEFTWNSLCKARRLGKGQFVPNRFYWAHACKMNGVPA